MDEIEDVEKQMKKNYSKKGSSSGDLFMKFGEKSRFRIVGKMKPILTVYYSGEKYIIPKEDKYIERVQELLGDEFPIKSVVVANVFDRFDQEARKKEGLSPRLKIIEKGSSIFENIIAYTKENLDEDGKRIHPGGPNGIDWVVNADIPADPKKRRNTKYTIIPMKPTPFTNQEKEVLARTENVELLKDLLSPSEYEKVVSKKYFEKFKDKPLGEKGLIDIDWFFNEEKNKKKLDELFAKLSGTPVESSTETTSKSKPVKEEEEFGADLDEPTTEEPKEEASGSSDNTDLDSLF